MKIIDRYLLRRFLWTLSYAILSFLLVVIFVDMVGNLAKFIDKDVPRAIILKYYLVSIPYILIWVLPIAILLACLFSIGQMARYNEIVAIKTAGVTLNRILRPIFIAGFLISGLAFLFGENVVPASNRQRTQIQDQHLDTGRKRSRNRMNNIYLRDSSGRRIFIHSYSVKRQLATRVSIQTYAGNKIIERIDAQQMKWQDSTWVLLNGFRRHFVDELEQAERFDSTIDSLLDVPPGEIIASNLKPEDMTYRELQVFIREVVHNGSDPKQWLVDYYSKFSLPLASFIMVLFGAPLAANKKRSGAIFGLIISILVWLVYYGATKFFQTLGQVGSIPPVLAAWSANGLFLCAGLLVLFTARK